MEEEREERGAVVCVPVPVTVLCCVVNIVNV